jgi:Flp pilus assembly protein TadD
MNSTLLKIAASSLVLGSTLVGCTSSVKGYRPTAASDSQSTKAYKAQQRALESVAKGETADALMAMERAVELSPTDAGYRRSLAELYLRSGRFASAEATYSDVLALNPGDSKAGFYLALSQLGQGKLRDALEQLEAMDSNVDPSDLGLALALAGNTPRGIALLEAAARQPTANGRVRQNLALAYALAGDWKRAKVTAEQDASPKDVAKRIEQWAALASSNAPAVRVAGLLGVSPVADPGQPARLALAPAAPEAPAVALAEAAPSAPQIPVVEEQAPVILAQAPAPPVRYIEETAAPVEAQPALIELPAPASRAAAPKANQARAARPIRAVASRPVSGKFVVQIGAFRSPAQVEKAWAQVYKRYPVGGGQPLSTTVNVAGKGVFHRLSIAGFGSREAAVQTCQSIRAKGGACFVRANAGDAPVQWASRYVRRV